MKNDKKKIQMEINLTPSVFEYPMGDVMKVNAGQCNHEPNVIQIEVICLGTNRMRIMN